MKASNKPENSKPGNSVNTVVTSPDVGVLVFGQDRKIISANDICAAMFGWSNLPGQDIAVLLRGGVQNEFGKVLKKELDPDKVNERFSVRIIAKRKDKSEFPASVIMTVSAAGTKACWTAIFQNIESLEESVGNTTFMRNASGELHNHAQNMAAEAANYREDLEQAQLEKSDLEDKLREANKVKQNLEEQLNEQMRTYEELLHSLSESQEELDEFKSNASEQEAELSRDTAQIEHLKDDLLALKKTCDDLGQQLQLEQQASATAMEENDKLQKQLEENRTEFNQSHSDHEQKNVALVQELESLREQFEADQAAALETEAQLKEQTKRVEELEEKLTTPDGEAIVELNELRESRQDSEQQQQELENRLNEINTNLARANADLEKERRERRRIEQRNSSLSSQLQEMHEELKHHLETERTTQDRFSELEEQRREQEDKAIRLQNELQKTTADFQLAEEQLQASGDMSAELERYRSLFEESKSTFQQTQEQLESQVQTNQRALRECESKLEHQTRERQNIHDLLTKVQRELQDETERSRLELTKLKSEFQVEQLERKRLEGGAVQSRYATLDSARSGRALVTRLHKQVREPVEDLLGNTRHLLDADLPEEQKTLLESILEKGLLIQTNLQEVNASMPSQSVAQKTEPAPSTEAGDSPAADEEQAA